MKYGISNSRIRKQNGTQLAENLWKETTDSTLQRVLCVQYFSGMTSTEQN